MTIKQFNECRSAMDQCDSRSEFIERFPGIDPGELVDTWEILQNGCSFSSIRRLSGLTQQSFCETYGIPKPTLESWCSRVRTVQPPMYTLHLMAVDVINERSHPSSGPTYIV